MKKLHEADFGDFSKDAGAAIDSISKHAGAAFGKFKAAHQAVTAKAQADKEKAESKARSDAERAAQAAERAKVLKTGKAHSPEDLESRKEKSFRNNKMALRIPRVIAQLCVGEIVPNSEEAIAPLLGDVKSDQFKMIFNAIKRARKRIGEYPAEMRARLIADDFLKVEHRSNATLNVILGFQKSDTLPAAEEELRKNRHKEQEAWSDVLALGDQTSMTRMFELMQQIGTENAKFNAEVKKNKGPKSSLQPETLGVVRLFSSQRMVIRARLEMLMRVIESMSSPEEKPAEKPAEPAEKTPAATPVTESLKRRLRRFVAEHKCNG